MVLPRARSVLPSAMLCNLWFHSRRTGQARSTACASTVSHDAFLITLPSGPPSPRWRSTCAHRQCSRAPSASLAAATTHSPRTFSPSPTRVAQPLLRCHNQIPNDQILNDSAAAAPPQTPELGSSTDTAKSRFAAVVTVAAAKTSPTLADVPSFAVGS